MNVAQANGVALHWREDGDPAGRPVVFANSLGTDLRLWDALIERLPKDLRLIRFDKRGHGLSDCPKGPYAISDLTADCAALMDYLGVKGAVFVGLSIGGMIGQALASARPDLVQALVLSNTAAKMGDSAMWHERITTVESAGLDAIAAPILSRWFGQAFLQSEALSLWRNMLTRTPRQGYVGCCHALAAADLSDTTAALTLPVLGIAGAEDGASPPDLVRATVDMIDGATCQVIQGAGHLPCVEAPDEYAALISRFLKETANV